MPDHYIKLTCGQCNKQLHTYNKVHRHLTAVQLKADGKWLNHGQADISLAAAAALDV